MIRFILAAALAGTALPTTAVAAADPYAAPAYVGIDHPAWSRKAVIYQVNTRQFTAEGTLKAALILWVFMHLAEAGGLLRVIAIAAFAWLAILFALGALAT